VVLESVVAAHVLVLRRQATRVAKGVVLMSWWD
jgi:hypothetical protein